MPLETAMGIFALIRPLEWGKSFQNMLLGAIAAYYTLNAVIDPLKFLYGFIAVALLWSGLYALNDWTDRKKDAKHPVKKLRPIPSGKISPKIAIFLSIAFILLSLVAGFSINLLFFASLAAMLLNELLYTLPLFNLKKIAVLDLISGSAINPFFRFFCGWALFASTTNVPALFVLFAVGIQFGGFVLYRLNSKKHEIELGYKSSVVVFSEKSLKYLSYFSIAIGMASFIALCLNQAIFSNLEFLGFLPLKFIWLAIGSLLLLPLYKNAIKNPQEMDMKKAYNLLYIHNLLFSIGAIMLFFTN